VFSREEGVIAALSARLRHLQSTEQHKLGFPGWSTPLPAELIPFFDFELNNYGDPYIDPVFGWHTKDLERELVEALADLFAAPPGDRWGYVTTGGSEGNVYGLWLGRTLYPEGVIYHSDAAHGSVAKNAEVIDRRAVVVGTDDRGEMDYDALRRALSANRDHAAIIVATIGTTMTEAVDDVVQIRRAVNDSGVPGCYIHADAALSGVPLAVLTDGPAFGLHTVDSLSFSGHKFLGAAIPCGVVITRASHRQRVRQTISYTGSPDPTLGSSRSGHTALVLWHRMRTLGVSGLRQMAEYTRDMASYAERELQALGWDAWRAQPHASTVVLKSPPQQVLDRWPLATVNGISHIICTPGVTRERLDHFLADLATSLQPSAAHATAA
jgi:histidine decarboxylase